MSSFLGPIKELPGISVDRFDNENQSSSAFFLSHCHSDHMNGLDSDFFENLKLRDRFLYCSEITKVLLEYTFQFDTSQVRGLEIDARFTIEYKLPSEEISFVSVTCMPAQHCIGSVMFLFEKAPLSILYTGDFRFDPDYLVHLKLLHYHCPGSAPQPRAFSTIYLDTTFLSRKYCSFPTRSESTKTICNLAKDWLLKDAKNIVAIEYCARIAYEFLLMELSELLQQRIHVREDVYVSYRQIPVIGRRVTKQRSKARIHACSNRFSFSECSSDIEKCNILKIRPSAARWSSERSSKLGDWFEKEDNTIYVCYATHSSLEELAEFLEYFKAKEVVPCVWPQDYTESETQSLLKDLINSTNNSEDDQSSKCELNYSEYVAIRDRIKARHSSIGLNNDD